MAKKRAHIVVFVVLFGLLAASCAEGSGRTETSGADAGAVVEGLPVAESTTPATSMTEIRVAALGTIDSSPLWIAESQGYFEEAGIDIRFVPVAGTRDVATALLDGRVDAISTSATQIVKLVAGGEPIQITNYLNATSPEATRHSMSLVAAEGHNFVSGCDLVNARVAVDEIESLIAHAVTQMIVNDGCNGDGVQFVEASLLDQPMLLADGSIDAIAVFEPYTAQAVRLGFVEVSNLDRELCAGVSRCPIGVVAMPDAFVADNPAVTEEFNRAISRALLWSESNQVEYRAELVVCCGITVDDAVEIRVFDWIGNVQALDSDLPRLMDLLESQGKLPNRPDMVDLLG